MIKDSTDIPDNSCKSLYFSVIKIRCLQQHYLLVQLQSTNQKYLTELHVGAHECNNNS